MMLPFDGGGGPQQGQPSVAPQPLRPPIPPGHVQASQSPVMPSGHHQPMNPPHYSHRGVGGMPGQSHYPIPSASPAQRQGSFSGGMPSNPGHYSSHPPLHSPHQSQQGPPMHTMPHPNHMHRPTSSMGRPPSATMGITSMQGSQHDNSMLGNSSQGSHNRHQQYMGTSTSAMSGNWQSDQDTPHRREMIQHIVKLLKKDRGGSPESMSKLPAMAKQLEVSLYRNATSFEAYMDMATLKSRLQRIAMEVSRRARGQDGSSTSRGAGGAERSHSSSHSPYPVQQNGIATSQGGSTSPFMNSSLATSSSNSGHMLTLDDINPMVGGSVGSQGYGGTRLTQANDHISQRGVQPQQQQQQQPPPQQQQPISLNQSLSSSQNRNDPEWRVRIRHKQQRLLLLHHSAKCPHEDGRCTVTPHCGDMKRLWRHMEGCKDNNCRVSHCFSSRAILSHYRKCKDPNCPACGPVRETVRKSKSSGSRPTAISTGELMNALVHASGSQQQQTGMVASSNSLPISASSSMGGNSFQLQSQHSVDRNPNSRLNMPPPATSVNGMQHSSSSGTQYQSSNSQQVSVRLSQPPYRQEPSQQQPQPLLTQKNGEIRTQPSRSVESSSRSVERASSPVAPPSSSRSSNVGRNDSEWQKIRHKQQRLLLLRHASRCQHLAGTCPVTPHCASMKKLWEHIAVCKSQQCNVQHCLSSRYVLSHYRRCKDPRCPACGPVRDTIRKSHDREKDRDQPSDTGFGNEGLDLTPTEPSMMSNDSPEEPVAELYQSERKRPKIEASPEEPPLIDSNPPITESIPIVEEVIAEVPVAKVVSKEPSASGPTDTSLLESFSVNQLETHLRSLDRKTQLPPAKVKAKCLEVLKGLQTHQHGWVFNCPVDPVELGLPDYFEIIKKPMDLGTIQKRLENGGFHAIKDFEADVCLTFDNAMLYNECGSVVYDMAKELKVKFASDVKKLMAQLETEDLERRQNDRACTLCGCEKLLFEPPVYFCNGMNCQSQRIRRNSHFYIGGNGQYFWCTTCFNELDDKIPIELVDMTIMKADLRKKKNDEVHEESWVECDTCQRWVHQICGLFNTRQNKEHHSEYCCPRCLLDKKKATPLTPPSPNPPGAADLPRTMLSEWLEQHVIKKVEKRKRELAEEKVQTEGISIEEAMTEVESGGPILIRQVTSMDRKLEVRELMRKRYAHKNYPEEFPFRCKCIVVFQELDGVDVILFALYLYEHGEDSPPPNQRVVYISYLDSVHFMRPRQLRTFVYHEILIAYLDYARRRGFSTAHIWACPPLKGDDYIFYAKPEDQKTPRDSRLRQWYIDLLQECQKRSICGKITNMYDLYFANESLDATCVPYLEGDYFPGEAENIIKILEDGGAKKGGAGGKKKKSKLSKNKGSTGTRSNGVDEEALIASGMFEGARSFKDLDRDQVMVKLGETIQPMKDSFIVAFLNWSGAKEEHMVVPDTIENERISYAASNEDASAGSKRDALGNMRDDASRLDKEGRPLKVIDDDTEELDCEFLNNRQAFLNLCRGNHYQFDELRRAKHTSMMILWHLHNRDAPKFVQQCVACNREILSGKRYHCNTCPDYDLCQDCYNDPNASRGSCSHKLVPIAVESDSNQERRGLTEAERLARQRNLELHIQLIEHASRCNSDKCSSSNCAKMKNYLQHSRVCRVKVQGGCKICKRIWTLLRIHAHKCKDPNCPIPQCNAIREKMRQLQKQQQAMDDRRRLEMNRHMRFSVSGGATE